MRFRSAMLRGLALLLTGALLGFWMRAPETPRVRTVTPRSPLRVAEAPMPPQVLATVPETRDAPVSPGTPAPAQPGFGKLEVELTNRAVGAVRVQVRDIEGLFYEQKLEPMDDHVGRMRLRAGRYQLLWTHDLAPFGREMPVDVAAGGVTRIDGAALDGVHVGPGLGVLAVDVAGYRGEPLRDVDVAVSAGEELLHLATDRRGRASAGLLPGEYRVAVGACVRAATIAIGRETRLEVRPGNQGELRVRAPGTWSCSLRRVAARAPRSEDYAEGPHGFVFVRPGAYEFLVAYEDGVGSRPVARVDIAPRRTTSFAYTPPPGGIVVGFGYDRPSYHVRVGVSAYPAGDALDVGVQPTLHAGGEPPRWEARCTHLPPGRYRVFVKIRNEVVFERFVTVEDETVVVPWPVAK